METRRRGNVTLQPFEIKSHTAYSLHHELVILTECRCSCPVRGKESVKATFYTNEQQPSRDFTLRPKCFPDLQETLWVNEIILKAKLSLEALKTCRITHSKKPTIDLF